MRERQNTCMGKKKNKKLRPDPWIDECKLNKTNAWVERTALSSVSGGSVKGFAHA